MYLKYCIFAALFVLVIARRQSFTAAGTLQCKGKPAANQEVVLKFTDPLLKAETVAKVKTGANGSFKIAGEKNDKITHRAYVWVEHKCDPKNRPNCNVMAYFPIPYRQSGKTFNVGKKELSKAVYYNSCDDIDA
ncbi:unnamed protein product [Cylicocyclus nassatus]|uniref:Transthyretin-like family protein n=1 Tax=Cylicocyclus nassatus TaxID=53992 RepID=A0AA36HAK6_CYLNA|nr:unnamed protein product [Cylicocyclus nassatus]